MVTSAFGSILKDLEFFFQCKLEPDSNQSCLIKLASGLEIQMEMAKRGEHFIIISRLGQLPMSRYRDNLIKEALKFNGLTSPRPGIFAFSQRSNNLSLFLKIDLRFLNPDKAAALLPSFIETAQSWKDAIIKGETPSLPNNSKKQNLFGMIR